MTSILLPRDTGNVVHVKLRHRTVKAALDDDEAFGFALARFNLADGDAAYNPANVNVPILGPAKLTYERIGEHITVRIS